MADFAESSGDNRNITTMKAASPENGATLSVQNALPFEAKPGNIQYYTEIGLPTGSNPGNYTLIVNLTSSYYSCQTSHIVYVNVTVPVNS